MHSEILQPIVVLVGWTMVMWAYMVATRLPAMKAAGIDLSKVSGSKPGQLDAILPPKAQWPAHNYMHLMEQPTVFYASALVLAVAGVGNGMNAWIAWAYVALRIVHSVVQVTSNKISIRFVLFVLSSLTLIAQVLHAAIAVFH